MRYVSKSAITVAALALVAGSDGPAAAEGTSVRWALSVTDILGQHDYGVSRGGGRLPSTGLDTCSQNPVRVFRDSDGNLQEEVRVTCELLGHKVTLIQSCYVTMPDRSFGAMRVEGVGAYTIGLQCANR
jgi:hypothetical protein